MSKITEISSSSQFDSLLRSNKVLVADFYATWCGPCKAIAPVYEQLSAQSSPGRLAFVKIDTDRNPDITRQHGVSAMPTFLVFKNGTITETIRGANAAALKSAIAKASSDASSGSAAAGSSFGSGGRRLGSAEDTARGSSSAGAGGVGSMFAGIGNLATGNGGMADTAVRFAGLYFTTLFSFDAFAAAQASPFSVGGGTGR